MSVEQGIHERWAQNRPLCTLLPADRLATGHHDAAVPLPYAELLSAGQPSFTRTSTGTLVTRRRIDFRLVGDSYAVLKEAAVEVLCLFSRASFRSGEATVLDMRPVALDERKTADGAWEVVVGFVTLST
jgi:hypothetical protein